MPKSKESRDFEDLRTLMEQVQKTRQANQQTNDGGEHIRNLTQEVKKTVTPVVNAFIKGDRALILQSSDEDSFYISYGYRHVCRLSIVTRSNDGIVIVMYADSPFEIYSGSFEKNKVEIAVKEALLSWYSGIFRV